MSTNFKLPRCLCRRFLALQQMYIVTPGPSEFLYLTQLPCILFFVKSKTKSIIIAFNPSPQK